MKGSVWMRNGFTAMSRRGYLGLHKVQVAPLICPHLQHVDFRFETLKQLLEQQKEQQTRLHEQLQSQREKQKHENVQLQVKIQEQLQESRGKTEATTTAAAGRDRQENLNTGSAGLNYIAPEFRPQSTSSEQRNYSKVPVKKKPQEFDGKASWEAYQAQFELLAEQNGRDDKQCAIQLATSLKRAVMEVLSQFTGEERSSQIPYSYRNRGETLQQLAQDLESMAHRAYTGASPDLLAVLLRDQFVDALDGTQLKIQVKQSQPASLQEALARTLEFEPYVRSSLPSFRTESRSGFKTRKDQVQEIERFKWTCWYCEKIGHKQEDCYKRKRERERGNTEKNMEKRTCWIVQVEGEIDGARYPLVIGTASEQTFVRPDVVSHLKLSETSQQLCGITGQSAVLKGPVDISIKLAREEETLQVYVAYIEDPCILDLDYLLHRRCQLVLGSMQLRIRRKWVPLWAVKHASANITVRQTRVISPRSEVRLPRKPDCQQCCRGEAVPKKCSRTTVEKDPAVAGEGLEKLQLEDQDLRPVVEWMNQSSVQPAWDTISGASPTTKNYWAQWDALRLKDGLLQRQWVTTNGLNRLAALVEAQQLQARESRATMQKQHQAAEEASRADRATMQALIAQALQAHGENANILPNAMLGNPNTGIPDASVRPRHGSPMHLYLTNSPQMLPSGNLRYGTALG
ncbi:hypothetical protein Hamer_G008775 [Homarus americanus]|uniref:CCHC-type domain-containing protein n=1 Tax=Homarus americanus TaxID=6706 RepID=A0A8J5JLF6_HOMAM|nr:hypothetical protein Hamer_G008775 [Homarus americanus]